MTRSRVSLAAWLALLGLAAGCNVLAPIAYYFRPREIQKPQYEFSADSRVALVIEAARPQDENPVFSEALHERVVEMLREGKSKATILPQRAVTDLRRANPDFRKWSLQKIGRAVQADHVLYVRLDRLVIRQSPDYPILTPAVDLRMKLIGVSQPGVHARLWPEAKEGYPVSCARQASEAADSDPDAPDVQARKLACDTAYYVTMPFIEVDLEQPPPVEP
jgi:hypothetical protein